MLRLTIIVTIIYCLTSCSNSDNKPVVIDTRFSPPEPDKDLREKYEEQQKKNLPTCVFDNPDTSLSSIKLRDAESATKVLSVKRLNGDTTYHFLTKDKTQLLGVEVHPGDYYSQISIFQIKYADKIQQRASTLPVEQFKTEKDIQLGLTKKEVLSRLGNCYSISDSTSENITLNYRLESPMDSRTNLLERQNMPIYYATYRFINDKLVEFEFGFEYP